MTNASRAVLICALLAFPIPVLAADAALLTWVTCYFLLNLFPTVLGVFPVSLVVILLAEGVVEIVVATLVGAYFYREA
jgi:CRISPR/Cas system CMR subunit Cmr4 (Cas7 group RAMP superfamily)